MMAAQAKLSTFGFKIGLQDKNNNVEVSREPEAKKKRESFQCKWLKKHHWLRYDEEKDIMFCNECRRLQFTNAMAIGSQCFKTTTLDRHLVSSDHKAALENKNARAEFAQATANVDSKEEMAITTIMKVVYWMAKECIPLTKYSSLIQLLRLLDTPNIDVLKLGEKVDYSSYTTACNILNALSSTLDKAVTEKLHKSPFITILTDESTDICVNHKLCISARIVDPLDLSPSTLFLTDLHITSATGEGIFNAIKDHLSTRTLDGIPLNITRMSGLGTDGASVMTGRVKGLTGQFLRYNPHLVNTHCSAHRVALCSEQAAKDIPGMKYYQQILESLFYYFKKSPERCDKMEAMQKLLDEPQLKYREVHQVRWLSFYQALDCVYRTIDSLLSYFSTCTDPKAIGFKKKIGEDFFIYTTWSLMDILQPVMKLSLFFQRKDVDI